jgi:predicted unusual protein kinase regulating ubiquinone biosynthesis (AarF/ABC1/UbiB family)
VNCVHEKESGSIMMEKQRTMQKRWVLDQAVRRTLDETWAVLTTGSRTPNPALFLARLADLARSNAFLWTEAGLQVQEQATHLVPVGQSLSRSLVLTTVAADIFVGYTTLRERAKWLPALVEPRDWELQHQRSANRVLETAASLGGALIKACQFASTRPDLLPAVYIRTLAPLQDRMPPRSWSEIEKAMTLELGRRPEDVFAHIEREAVAAASIAQVHRARLHDGRDVAVKVQYPDIENLVGTDLAVLEQVVKAIAQLAPGIQLQPIVDYLKETLPLELDFTHEAEAMTSLRLALAHRADALVPAVLPELSSERLLVMDYIEGIKITDRQALEQAGISPHEVARLLNDLYAEQMLHLGMLHADPHPGNLLVQPGPRLVLLDHGLTVPLAPRLVDSLRKMVQALTRGDFDELAGALAEAGLRLEGEVDIMTLLNLVGVLLGNNQTGESKEDVNAFDVGMQLGKSVGTIPTDLLLVGRALGLLDGITKQLDPNMDTMEIVADYA